MYQTPELLLVGAAQHLVLGVSINTETFGSGCLNVDEKDGAGLYHDVGGW
jgi:hypothetical protein